MALAKGWGGVPIGAMVTTAPRALMKPGPATTGGGNYLASAGCVIAGRIGCPWLLDAVAAYDCSYRMDSSGFSLVAAGKYVDTAFYKVQLRMKHPERWRPGPIRG